MTGDKRGTARGPITYPDVRGFLPPSVVKPTGEEDFLLGTVLGKQGHPQPVSCFRLGCAPLPYVNQRCSRVCYSRGLVRFPCQPVALFALGFPHRRSRHSNEPLGRDQGLKTVPTAQGGCYLQVDGIPDPRSSLASRCGFGLPPGSRWLLHSRQTSSPAGPLPSQECANRIVPCQRETCKIRITHLLQKRRHLMTKHFDLRLQAAARRMQVVKDGDSESKVRGGANL